MKSQIISFIIFSIISQIHAEYYFEGIVKDAVTFLPLDSVKVHVEGTESETWTDAQGRFVLDGNNIGIRRHSSPHTSSMLIFHNKSVSIRNNDIGSLKLKVFNIQGRQVMERPAGFLQSARTRLDLSGLACGVYFARFVLNQKPVLTVRFIRLGRESMSIRVSQFSGSNDPARPKILADKNYTLGFCKEDYGVLNNAYGTTDSNITVMLTGSAYDTTGAFVFDEDSLRTYEFTLPDSTWDWLKKHAVDEEYVSANLAVAGVYKGNVGLRFKGGFGTLTGCVDSSGAWRCSKLSMKVKFNKYDKEKRFHSLKRLNFHSMNSDESHLHDRLAYWLFRQEGIYTCRTAHARIVVNGEVQGLFALVEQIDGRFTANRFPRGGDGNLYKEVWPEHTTREPYDEKLKTNEGADTYEMVDFATDILNSTEQNFMQMLSQHTDTDYLLKYIAVDRAIGNWDGIMAWYCMQGHCGNHNYYWYHEDVDSTFWLIPWDLDNTFSPYSIFSNMPEWFEHPVDCEKRYPVFDIAEAHNPGCNKLIGMLGKLNEQAYLDALDGLLSGTYNLSRMNDKLDKWVAQIRPFVQEDPNGPGEEAWERAVEDLKGNLVVMKGRMENVVKGIKNDPMGLTRDRVNGFNGASEAELQSYTIEFCNSRSTMRTVLNRDNPIDGNGDVKIEFEYRNESDNPDSGMGSQFGLSGILFENYGGIDLSGIVEMLIEIRADGDRQVLIQLGSPLYTNGDDAVFYGWLVAVSDTIQALTLKMDDLSGPWYAPIIPDKKEDILTQVNALLIRPLVEGTVDGLLPAGQADSGFVEIDNIEFIPR